MLRVPKYLMTANEKVRKINFIKKFDASQRQLRRHMETLFVLKLLWVGELMSIARPCIFNDG